jgi:hypothetical protein
LIYPRCSELFNHEAENENKGFFRRFALVLGPGKAVAVRQERASVVEKLPQDDGFAGVLTKIIPVRLTLMGGQSWAYHET